MVTVRKVKCVVKYPRRPAVRSEILDDLYVIKALQHWVGGYIECDRFDNIVVFSNEDGKLQGLPYNMTIAGNDFVGPIVIVGTNGVDLLDIPEDFAEALVHDSTVWEYHNV